MQPEAAPPVVHVVIAVDVDEQQTVSQFPLLHVTSPLHETPLPFLA